MQAIDERRLRAKLSYGCQTGSSLVVVKKLKKDFKNIVKNA
jgi:hypothetical protein